MKIEVIDSSSRSLHNYFKERFNAKYQSSGFEGSSTVARKTGNLSYKSYDFGNGLIFNILTGDISKLIQIEFAGTSNDFIRYIFLKQGELILNLTKKLRTRLSSGYSSIVAVKGSHNQIFTIPVQKNLELFFIEINKLRFTLNMQNEVIGLPKELMDVFISKQMEEDFIYHSSYTLSITDTYNEIISSEAEGIVKRFFLESKVLELLWLQTVQCKNELLYGYDPNVLRKVDVELIKKAKDFVHQNCEKELTLNLISRTIGTNETKLKTGFKKLYGKTFSEILRSERLNKSKSLLDDKSLSVKEIATACGYKSVSMFSLRFKERFGFAPSQLKKS